MPLAVGIALAKMCRPCWFDPGDLQLAEGDRVVVETTRGVEIGVVKVLPNEVAQDRLPSPVKRVMRKATARDDDAERRHAERSASACRIATDRARHHALPMKILTADYAFDGSMVTIYFTAENRVDFRELVKDLAGILHTKVQLYQIGARDQARMAGGLGTCGRTLCCATFLTEFAPISMKMAKDQSLFLNPVKFSGVCGKLLCCLRFEHESYVHIRKSLPRLGQLVETPDGQGKVVELNTIRRRVVVSIEPGTPNKVYEASQLQYEQAAHHSDEVEPIDGE